MIYYADTNRFAKKHADDIWEMVTKFQRETGEPLKIPSDGTQRRNFLAWFAWESFMIEWIDYMES